MRSKNGDRRWRNIPKDLCGKDMLEDEGKPMMKKIACLFPGIGYTCDKQLFYYSWKLLIKS